MPINQNPWSANAEENEAIEATQALIGGMAAMLHGVTEAAYVDPAGGFTPGA